MRPTKRASMNRRALTSAVLRRAGKGFSDRGGLSLIVNVGFGRF
jgi:hypothetical protein